MARWLVQLEGDHLDLRVLPREFPNGDVYAVQEGDEVYLVGPAFESLGEADQVHDKALEELDLWSAVMSLLDPRFCRPVVGNILRDDDSGGRKGWAFASLRVGLRSRLRGAGELVRGEAGKKLSTQAQLLLQGCRGNDHLREAVALWADPSRTWPRLYRVLEEVEQYLGQPVHKADVCSESERRRFTHSANTAEVAGKDGRHASGKFVPPARPMNLGEALSFIGGILRMVLDKAAPRN